MPSTNVSNLLLIVLLVGHQIILWMPPLRVLSHMGLVESPVLISGVCKFMVPLVWHILFLLIGVMYMPPIFTRMEDLTGPFGE